MEFYLEALESQQKFPEENPPIGIIICREKNKTIVEYALRNASRPLGVATYQAYQKIFKLICQARKPSLDFLRIGTNPTLSNLHKMTLDNFCIATKKHKIHKNFNQTQVAS